MLTSVRLSYGRLLDPLPPSLDLAFSRPEFLCIPRRSAITDRQSEVRGFGMLLNFSEIFVYNSNVHSGVSFKICIIRR